MTIGLPVITEKSKYTLHPENDNNRVRTVSKTSFREYINTVVNDPE